MTIKSMDLAWVVVADIKKALEFYTQSLGLKIKSENLEHGWVELQGENGALLGLSQSNAYTPFEPGNNAVVTMTVQDIKKAKEELAKKGVKMLGEIQEIPGHVKLQMIEDQDGNKFQLVEDLCHLK